MVLRQSSIFLWLKFDDYPFRMQRFLFLLFYALPLLLWGRADTTALPAPNWALNLPASSFRTTAVSLGLLSATHRTGGVQLGLFSNVARTASSGVQLAGVCNFARGEFLGLQAASLFNYAHRFGGVQLASVANLSQQAARGVQLSGITNLAIEGDRLVQVGMTNIALGSLRGVQVGVANHAGSLHGVQVGIFNNNTDAHARGVQVGIVNASLDSTAVKIGLVNYTPATRAQLLFFVGNACRLNLAVRFLNRRFYTMLGVGVYYYGWDRTFSGALSYRAGYRLPLSRRWALAGDVGYAHIEEAVAADNYARHRQFALQSRLGLECRLVSACSLFATGGYAIGKAYSRHVRWKDRPLVELGVLLF